MSGEYTWLHFKCDNCGIEVFKEETYPDELRICNACRIRLKILTDEHYQQYEKLNKDSMVKYSTTTKKESSNEWGVSI